MPSPAPRHGLARVLSKLGICSRSQATALVRAGRVQVNGIIRRNPEHPVSAERDVLQLDGAALAAAAKVYLMLNKPRGLVTTASDEKGRATIWQCLEGAALPPLHAVGRLDMASEGLLLLTNDTAWSAAITEPVSAVPKVYHVQIDRVAEAPLLTALLAGVRDDEGHLLKAQQASLLRAGTRTSWLEITLDEGRNRHIRRLLQAQGCEVQRLVRVRIGSLSLGNLAKGQWRLLTASEVQALASIAR